MDVCCPWGHRSAWKPTKDYTWDWGSLSFRLQEAQTMPLHCFEQAETLEKPRWNHQKDRHDKNRRNCGPHNSRPQGSTPATGINTTKTTAQNNCGRDQILRREDRDMSQTIWYNCKKKDHFATQCPDPHKPKN